MLLHPTLSPSPPPQNHHQISLSPPPPSPLSHSLSFQSGFRNSNLKTHRNLSISCSSISQVHSYGTVDYEKRPSVAWKAIYKRISVMGDTEKGSAGVLNQWENEGRRLTKWELCRLVKELRKFRRYKLALEIYDWMSKRPETFAITASDTAIQLDLVGKVHGISRAENYFTSLPDALKDKRTYGSLLNSYVRQKMKEKAESLFAQMREREYTSHALPFNVMMTLYMNLKDYDKVESIISEMMEKRIDLDVYSYNIWLSSRGSQGLAEKMEEVFQQMEMDRTINPNWTTFSTMASLFIKMGQMEKALHCLKNIESRITGRDRVPYHYLISHYGSIGNKEEVHRVWNTYKSIFQYIPNLGYHAVISSFVRLNDIEEAEKIYEEWLSVKMTYDPRIGNLIMGWYVRKGHLDKAGVFFNEMIEVGGKPNSSTWEIVAEGNIKEGKISDALSSLEKAVLCVDSNFWKPKPSNISAILKLCEQEGDEASKEVLFALLRRLGCFQDEAYMSYLPQSKESSMENELPADDEEPVVLLNELEVSL